MDRKLLQGAKDHLAELKADPAKYWASRRHPLNPAAIHRHIGVKYEDYLDDHTTSITDPTAFYSEDAVVFPQLPFPPGYDFGKGHDGQEPGQASTE